MRDYDYYARRYNELLWITMIIEVMYKIGRTVSQELLDRALPPDTDEILSVIHPQAEPQPKWSELPPQDQKYQNAIVFVGGRHNLV